MAQKSRIIWLERIRRWEQSGLTAGEFAAKVGVKEGTLRHWKWQLGWEARGSRQPVPAPPKVRLLPVRVKRPVGDVCSSSWEIRAPSGPVLRVEGPLTERQLELVLAALTASR
jgi:hypothetical protein